MPATHEIVATIGEYTDATGATKKRYLRCGTGFTKDGNFSIKLDAIPGPGWNGWMSCFLIKERDNGQQRAASPKPAPAAQAVDEDDDIPF